MTSFPLKEGDVVMVELETATYAKKGNTVEMEGKLKSRGYTVTDQKGFVFEAERLFNVTYGYSTIY